MTYKAYTVTFLFDSFGLGSAYLLDNDLPPAKPL